MSIHSYVLRVLDLVARTDSYEDITWRTDGRYSPVTFWVRCPDLFHWATSDAEELTEETLPDLVQAYADVAATTGNYRYGAALYCARRRRMRPQGVAYPSNEKLWPLFDACESQRETGQ